VSLGIATGFERHYGVLERLGLTPLGRPRLVAAKMGAVAAIEVAQLALLGAVASALGWSPSIRPALLAVAALAGTAAFAGIGLGLAGRLSGPANLAASNGVYLLLLLLGGVAVPAGELPGPLGTVAGALPSGALVDALRSAVGATDANPATWAVLLGWAVLAPLAAVAGFRWSAEDR
jgi:ABC-2 type transport system permease protein